MAAFEKLKKFESGKSAQAILLLLDITEKTNRNGGTFCQLLFSDGEEKQQALMWDVKKESYKAFINKLVKVVIKPESYKDSIHLLVLYQQRYSLYFVHYQAGQSYSLPLFQIFQGQQ